MQNAINPPLRPGQTVQCFRCDRLVSEAKILPGKVHGLFICESCDSGKPYRIVRHYFKAGHRTIRSGLTFSEAREHCSNPETSSSTCKLARNVRRTERMGQWFDGFEEEK